MADAQLEKGRITAQASPSPATGSPVPYKPALLNLAKAGVALLVTFWICAVWLFGSYYKMTVHVHQAGCLVVDLDGGAVGSALMSAVDQFQGLPTAPTFDYFDSSNITMDQVEKKVFGGDVWCAIVANAGATDAFNAAVAAGSTTAASYDATAALTYVGLQGRFPTQWNSVFLPFLEQVVQGTAKAFGQATVAPLLTAATTGEYSTAQVAVLLEPISSTFDDLAPFQFSETGLLNTIGMVLPMLFQFFFLMSLNGIFNAMKLYRGPIKTLVRDRLLISAAWCFFTSLSVTGWTLAFHESYHIEARNFFALWAVNWVFAIITFDIFDFLTSFVPPQLASLPIVLWLIISVASTASPIELDNRFFRVHWFFPAHATWISQITIYTRGGVNRLYATLPILAAWLVVARTGSVFGLIKKSRDHHRAQATAVGPPGAAH